MNYRYDCTVSAKEKKERPLAAALALAVGLVLACLGSAVLATPGTPIQGTPIGLEGDPGSIKVSTTTDEHGAFNFTKLPAGKYKLTLPGLPSQSLTVRADGIVGGVVLRGHEGSITVRKAGDVPVEYVFRPAPSPKGGRLPGIGVTGVDDKVADGNQPYKTASRPDGSDLPTSNKPIPGIDIVVKKNPGGIPVVVPIDDSGKFSLRLKEPGNHTISTACRQPSGCLPHKLSGALKPGADGEPSIIAILIGLLLPAQKASADGMTFDFTVGDRGVFLSGQFQDAAGVRVGVGDINGDGRRVAVAVNTVNDAPGKAGGPYLEVELKEVLISSYKMADNSSPLPTDREIIVGAGPGGGPHSSSKPTSISGKEMVDARTAPPPKDGDGKSAAAEPRDIFLKPPVTPRDGGDEKLPGKIGVINNSETDTATIHQSTPVNGIGGMGGGRLTAGGAIDGVNVGSSNRDHIDQDAQTDIKKKTAVQTGGPGDARIRMSADVSTLRGTAPGPGGGEGKLPLPGLAGETISPTYLPDPPFRSVPPKGGDDKLPGLAGEPIVINGTVIVSRAATSSKGGNDKLPGLAGEAVAGLEVKLGKLGGGNAANATVSQSGSTLAMESIVSSKTDSQGNFYFDKLPAGNYELTLPGLPSQALTVGTDGIADGRVMRGPDGSMSIFDRWGNRTATSPKGGGSKTVEKPVGFGSGNTMGAGPGGMGLGGSMAPPGAGPAMGGAGSAIGGPGSAMGGPGSAMRNR